MDHQALRSEMLSGPLAADIAPLLEAGNHTAAAAVLNRRADAFAPPADWTRYVSLPRADLLLVTTALGAGPALEAAAPTNPAAWAFLLLLRSPTSELDIRVPAVRAMAGGLDAAAPGLGIALVARGTVPASRAEIAAGRPVTPDDIGTATRIED